MVFTASTLFNSFGAKSWSQKCFYFSKFVLVFNSPGYYFLIARLLIERWKKSPSRSLTCIITTWGFSCKVIFFSESKRFVCLLNLVRNFHQLSTRHFFRVTFFVYACTFHLFIDERFCSELFGLILQNFTSPWWTVAFLRSFFWEHDSTKNI